MPTGVIRRSVLSKSSLVAVPSLYTALRKTSWGGLFPVYGDDKEGSPLSGKKTKNIIGRVVQGPGSVSVLDEEYSDYDEDDEKWDEDTDERPYRGFRKKSFEEKPIKTTKKMITKANRSERGGRSDNHNSQLVRKSETREMADESNNHDELEGRPVGSIRRLRSQLRAKQLSAIRKRRTQSTDDKDSSDS